MAKIRTEECRDITETGEKTLQAEIHRDGTMTVLCPCCGGCREHDSHPGNNPDNCAYPCSSCSGEGILNSLPELRALAGRRPA